MVIVHRFAIAIFALVLGVSGMATGRAYAAPSGTAAQTYGQDRGGWDTPPQELREIQRQGFRDGIIGAQKDFDNHRRWDPNNRDEYRNPRLPLEQREAYRDGFRRGYQRGVDHLTGHDQQLMRDQDRGGPDRGRDIGPGPGAMAVPAGDVRRRGFQDGMDGALKDLDNRRQPDPNNRNEYRTPNVPFEVRDAYRDSFRDGYQRGMAVLTGGPGEDRRYQGPGTEIRSRGFHDGAEGAVRDYANHRQPDPNNRDEFRRPVNVPYELQEAYRDGFRRGYEVVSRELMGYSDRR